MPTPQLSLIHLSDQRLGRVWGEQLSRDPLFSGAEAAAKYTAAMRRSAHQRKNPWRIKQLQRIGAMCRFYAPASAREMSAFQVIDLLRREPDEARCPLDVQRHTGAMLQLAAGG